jgi:tetratricopeptide (TPR) repeat protein
VEYLFRLMEDGEFEKCLQLAEQQLLRGGMTLIEMATLNMVICRCRLGVQDPYGAINSGLLAIKLARDTGEWDTLGRSLLNVGTAYMGTRQYDLALQHLYSYFENAHLYATAHRFEGAVWRSIGVAHQRKLETHQAITALNRGRQWFTRQGVDQSAFSCLHDLVHTYLQQHEVKPGTSLEPVAALLREERILVAKHPAESYFRGHYLYDQAEYYLHAKRHGRALVCAMKAMEARKGDHPLNFHAYMVISKCYRQMGEAKQALGHALAARVEALKGRHYELEFVAAQTMVELIRQQGAEMVRELDQEYQAIGVDLGQYLSPALLGRQN